MRLQIDFCYLRRSNASILWKSVKPSSPILMRYGRCKFAAIANGKPHSLSEWIKKYKTKEETKSHPDDYSLSSFVVILLRGGIVFSSSLMAQCQVISLFSAKNRAQWYRWILGSVYGVCV